MSFNKCKSKMFMLIHEISLSVLLLVVSLKE